MNVFFFFGMLLSVATLTTRAVTNPIDTLAQDKRVSRCLAWIDKNPGWVTQQQIAITEIPAPEFHEAERAAYVAKLFKAMGFSVRTDAMGNVVAERAGANPWDVIVLVAHLDTVFPQGTNVSVRRVGGRLEAPGISDDGAGLAALVAVGRALKEGRVKTQASLVFSADVGEEGEGNLRGIRQLLADYRGRIRGVIAIDGAATDYVTTIGLVSRRLDIQVVGPGGHSWSDFGAPNPITALSRGIVQFSGLPVPGEPRTTFNFGVVAGGTSVNSIPAEASLKVDLRSEDNRELARLEEELRKVFLSAVDRENAASARGSEPLRLQIRMIGMRPGGKLPADSPLLAAIENVDRYLGNRARLERSSTDANLPLSEGIPAIAIGGGGQGGGAHSLEEWYDPAGRELGLKRIVLTALAVAGI